MDTIITSCCLSILFTNWPSEFISCADNPAETISGFGFSQWSSIPSHPAQPMPPPLCVFTDEPSILDLAEALKCYTMCLIIHCSFWLMIKMPCYEWIKEINPKSNNVALRVLNSYEAEFRNFSLVGIYNVIHPIGLVKEFQHQNSSLSLSPGFLDLVAFNL